MPVHFGGDDGAPGKACTVYVQKPGKAFPGLFVPDMVDNLSTQAIDNITEAWDDGRGVANPDSFPDKPFSFQDGMVLDAGNSFEPSATIPEVPDAADEPVSRLPTGVQVLQYDANPQMLQRLNRGDLSEAMLMFLKHYHHADSGGVYQEFGYNLFGWHPMHTLAEELRQAKFPK